MSADAEPDVEPKLAPRTPEWLAPSIIGSALLMHQLGLTVVFNALPTMAAALRVDTLQINLVVSIFMLATTIFMPISAWVADRFGAKRVLMAAMVLFALSSATCGLAQRSFPGFAVTPGDAQAQTPKKPASRATHERLMSARSIRRPAADTSRTSAR